MSDSDVDSRVTFKVEVASESDDSSLVQLVFDKIDSGISQDSLESDDEQINEIRLTPTINLHRLSNDITGAAIGFFEIVPNFTERNFQSVSSSTTKSLHNVLSKLALEKKQIIDSERELTQFTLNIEELPFVAKSLGRTAHSFLAVKNMSQAALGALLSDYEARMRELLKILSELKPDAFVSGDEQISLDEVRRYGKHEDLMDALVEKKIDDIFQKSHSDQLHWIESKFGVNLTSNMDLIDEFFEVCQRRHLIIHNGGRVNRRYLEMCAGNGLNLEDLPKLGEQVEISRKYLRRATARVYQVLYFSLHILWQRVIANDRDRSVGCILSDSHEFLENDLTKMARRLCEFSLYGKNKLSSRINAYLHINLAQSYLFDVALNEEEQASSVERILAKRDWSERSQIVALALACLRRDYSELNELTSAAKSSGLSRTEAHTYSIFREIRELPDFIDHFDLNEILKA